MRIRILYTLPNFNTAGSGKALLNLALGLNREQFEAHIACESDKGSFFETVKKSGIQVHVFNYIPKRKPVLNWIKQSLEVRRKLKEIKPDIVHSFHYSDNYTEGAAARLAGIKWVFTKKNMSWGGGSGNGWKFRSALANGIAVQNTDMITNFYPESKKVGLIPRGVDVKKFEFDGKDDAVKIAMKSEKQRVIICVANMVPVKGVELLLRAFDTLHSSNANWSLWLIGDINNKYGQSLTEQASQLKSADFIHFSGKQPDVKRYLNHAEIFVLPTKDEGRREGSPVALLEAMANGKVVVGSAVPGVKDQLSQFPEHQFEPGNWQSLTQKLSKFTLNSTAENHKIGKKFNKHVSENYSIELEIKRHEDFYKKVLNDE